MDFSAVPFTGGVPEDILNFNGGQSYSNDTTGYGDIYSGNGTNGDAFTQGSEFQTEESDEQYSTMRSNGGEYQESRTVLIDGGDRFGVSALSFDTKEELLWMGNQGGHVTSYLSAELMKYTSFQVHQTDEIRDLLTTDAGIWILTPTALDLYTRQGLHSLTFKDEAVENMQCMLNPADFPDQLLIGGHQDSLLEYDMNEDKITTTYAVGEEGCVIIRDHQRFFCHADLTGRIVLHDPRTMRGEHVFQPHTGSLTDFDVQGNYIISCGFSNRMGQMIEDQFVMVYDMRMMKMSVPLRALLPPYYLRFLPGLTSSLAAISLLGHWQILDVNQPDDTMLGMNYQINCPPDSGTLSYDVSSSSQALAFGDSMGSIHLFTTGNKPVFNNFSRDTVLPSDQPQFSIPITDVTASLGTVPLYYPDSPLLSDWPQHLMRVQYRPTPYIDPHILGSVKMVGAIGYAPNTQNIKRNQVPYKLSNGRGQKTQQTENSSSKSESGFSVHVPRRYRKIEIKYSKMGMDDFDYDHYNRTSFSGLEMSLPNSYCNPVLQVFYYIAPLRAVLLSHLCEREFCLACELGFLFHMLDISMGQGLPCHAANFLRAFRTIPEASAMSLTLSDSDNRSKINFATKIQSWNCFVLQQIHTETLEYRDPVTDASLGYAYSGHLPNAEQRRVDSETEGVEYQDKREYSPVSDIFGAHIVTINRCTRCRHQIRKDITSSLVNLSFVETAAEMLENTNGIPFSRVVERSMCLEQTTQAWCDSCMRYQPIEQFRRYKTLPNAIAMNCGLDSNQEVKFWQSQFENILTDVHEKLKEEVKERGVGRGAGEEENSNANNESPTKEFVSSPVKKPQEVPIGPNVRPCRYGNACVRPDCKFWHRNRNGGPSNSHVLTVLDQTMEHSWVPLGLCAKLNTDGTVSFSDISKDKFDSMVDSDDGIIYELCGVVSHVSDPRYPEKNNLVACIKVGPSFHERANVSPVSHWYLFNDISILPINAEEAVWFPCGWKQPCVLYWVRRTLPPHLATFKETSPITTDVFMEDKSLAQRGRKRITFTPLTADEMPNEGELVSMDAEFVNLHQEEAEIRSDGTRTTIKPSHKAVARITCIRGHGILERTPFMDDYISTQEQVVDYLTQFSGIKPGDLDANYSQKHLTTLKSTYLKLRYLVDRGVKFVGHGLKNDFRVINMVVPQHQLVDTVHLFHMPHNRMVSLKFLAWYFLKLKIQSVTHDSIEDARTALALYQKHQQLISSNMKVIEIQKLYESGKKAQWKVPGEDDEE